MVIRTSDYPDQIVRFASYNPGDAYQSIHLVYDQGEVSFEISTENRYGSYVRRYTTRDTLYDELATDFYYDSVMYDPGFSNWALTWRDSAQTAEISVTLLRTGDIPLVTYGEPLGAIKVSSEHVATIEAFPVGRDSLRIDHPEFSYEDSHLDQTPDGDYIMFVPAGLWDVKLYPRGDALVENYKTLLVPVNSGEMTTVEVPFGISNALKSGGADYDERGIRIGSIREDESQNQVTFSFTLPDKSTRDILPDLSNTAVLESGVPVRLIHVTRARTPPSVVLLLDSSGSMRGQMQDTLSSARSFIEGLPEQTTIRIVDFDDVLKKLDGTTKAAALANLPSIAVGGDTALYNAIGLGIDLLAEDERPTLVVFTDGENDLKNQDTLSLEETLALVSEAGIPLYTIGFGQDHDSSTLNMLAEVSDGQYFSAGDADALDYVFAAINERLGNTFEATYERPLEASIGDVPVVSFVIDTSGSMIQDASELYGSRIHNVKNLLRQFVLELPSDVQMQLSEFSEEVRIVQATTTDKMKILRGLGRLEASGGTNITGSVLASYKTLQEIPSTKKVLVFITDAALDTTHPDNDFFRELLAEIEEDDINILWVGLGVEEGSEDFRLAAEITGGAYIISEDIGLLTERFNEVLRDVRESPRSSLSNIYIGVEKINAVGARESYATGKLAELSPIKKSGEIVVSQTIQYTTGSMLSQYDAETAAKLSGRGIPAQDTIITNRMQVGRSGASDALKVTVDDVFFMNRLSGVDAPSGYRYMALAMQLQNILAPQEVTVYPDGSSHPASWLGGGAKGETKWLKIPYMIPDFSAHFALSYNDEGAYPGSLATWLTAQSLPAPGDTALTVIPDETRPGTVVFLVPDMEMEQAALHYYDTNYGHIDIPLVGEMRHMPYELPVWPKQEPAHLSDTFALEITGYHEIPRIPGTGQTAGSGGSTEGITPGAGAVFKVVEGNFTAQVQALLNIDPAQRFLLRVSSGSGDFYLPVSPATGLLPAGFCYPRMIAPGSFNKVRWLFEVPEGIRAHAADLFIDLSDDDKTATITGGGQLPGQLNARFTSDYIDVTVNQLVRKEDGINDHSGAYIIADITIHDKKDGYATTGIESLFSVVSDEFFTAPVEVDDEADGLNLDDEASHTGLDNFAQGATGGGSSETRIVPASLTGDLILGFTDDSVVFDGTSRRGLLVFRCIDDEQDKNWYLYTHVFQDLKIEVGDGAFDSSLLGEKTIYDEDNTFAQELNAAIALAVDAYRLRHPDKSAQLTDGTVPLDGLETDKQAVPVPSVCLYGAEQLDAIRSVDELVAAMKQLRFIPSTGSNDPFENTISAEALLTQGFGMEQDYANLAVDVLARLGYQPKLRVVRLTDQGKAELAKMSGVASIAIDELPAVSYVREDNTYHVLVMPFVQELSELKRLVYLDYEQDAERLPGKIRLEITALGYLTEKGVREQFSDFSDALGGDSGDTNRLVSKELYSDTIDLDLLSLDAIDIGIAKDGNKARIYMLRADGEIFGDEVVELDMLDVRQLQLRIDLPNQSGLIHTVRLDEGMAVDAVFLTVSINAPDIPREAALLLQEKAAAVHAMAENPSELSALRWYGRRIIYDFIAAQTERERTISADLDLIAGRTQKPRVIVVTQKAGDTLQTSISLIETGNEIHAGKEDDIRTFNIVSGLYALTLEADALPGDANGLAEIWSLAPAGTGLVLLDYIGEETRGDLEKIGLPEDLIGYFIGTSRMILIPENPSQVDGRLRWAWLEIDPDTHELYSVIDTLEKGAFVENTVVDIVKSAAQYAVGAFKGVETAIWSVAVFSLETDDYHEILKSARSLALGLADRFGFNYGPVEGGIGSKPSLSQAVGPVKFSFDGSAGMSQNVLSFTDGYKAGVAYYFSQAD